MSEGVSSRRHAKEVVYTPDSWMKRPLPMLKEMGQDMLAARELGWRLTIRDISALYRQTFLGYIWAFVPALVTGATLSVASQNKVVNFGDTDIPYTAYVIIGMVLWQTFMEAITLQISALSKAKEMLSKVNFLREGLILSGLGQTIFNFLVKFVLVVAAILWYEIPVGFEVFFAPLALLMLILLGTGIGVLLAPVGGLFDDIARGIVVSTTAFLIITPVVFVPPENGVYATIVAINPVTPLLVSTRDLMTTGVLTYPVGFILASVFTLLLCISAWATYRLSMPIIIERMNA